MVRRRSTVRFRKGAPGGLHTSPGFIVTFGSDILVTGPAGVPGWGVRRCAEAAGRFLGAAEPRWVLVTEWWLPWLRVRGLAMVARGRRWRVRGGACGSVAGGRRGQGGRGGL